MPTLLLPGLSIETLVLMAVTIVVAGLVRGFSGFGSALIFMPVASSLIDPRLAAGTFLLVDFLAAAPMVFNGFKVCDWRTVWPAVIGAVLLVPVGAMVLAIGDTISLRWAISIIALALLALIASGWRYGGAPRWPVSVAVGATAGFMGGLAQTAGPPVIAYWMSGPAAPRMVRANIIVFFFLGGIASFASYWLSGIFSPETPKLFMVLLPVYALSIFAGTKLFGHASPATFRWVALILVGIAATTSLPVFDGFLR